MKMCRAPYALRRLALAVLLWAQSLGLLTSVTAETLSIEVSESLKNYFHHLQTALIDQVLGEPLMAPEALQQFYTQRVYWPVWSRETALLPEIERLRMTLSEAEQEGLTPQGYRLQRLEDLLRQMYEQQRQGNSPAPHLLAALDLLLSDAFLAYASHLRNGTTNARGPVPASPEDTRSHLNLLQQALAQQRFDEVLQRLPPSDQAYARLRRALSRYRALATAGGWPTIAAGPSLRLHDRSDRVATLRTRLRLSGDLSQLPALDENWFDDAVAQAVRSFQQRHGLDPDGVVGPQTLEALNVSAAARVQQLIRNMERRRWLPDDLGQRYIMVNVPAFTLDVVENTQVVMTMRVVVGKPSWPTPVLSAPMSYLVLSPSWSVPHKIAKEEILPLLRRNPVYLAEHNMRVWHVGPEGRQPVDPHSIDWSQVRADNFTYQFHQAPGPKNPLGDIKFMFPNPHQVYLHDTRSRRLFSRTSRAFSHGCVRVEKPFDLAAYVLQKDQTWTLQRLNALKARQTAHTVRLPEPITVHLVYWTAWVSEDGRVHFRSDIYAHDSLGLHEAS